MISALGKDFGRHCDDPSPYFDMLLYSAVYDVLVFYFVIPGAPFLVVQ